MSPTSFVDLPPELRLQIYTHLFRTTDVTVHALQRAPYNRTSRRCRNSQSRKCIALLLANRLLNQEAQPLFLQETSFRLTGCPCWKSPSRRLPTSIQNLTVEERNERWTYTRKSSRPMNIQTLTFLSLEQPRWAADVAIHIRFGLEFAKRIHLKLEGVLDTPYMDVVVDSEKGKVKVTGVTDRDLNYVRVMILHAHLFKMEDISLILRGETVEEMRRGV